MPIIPKLNPNSSNLRPIEGGISAQAPIEAFGGGRGIYEVQSSQMKAVDSVLKLIEIEKEKADEVNVLDASKQLREKQISLMFDPTTGALNQKGKGALDAQDKFVNEYNSHADKIEADLGNSSQRAKFKQIRDNLFLDSTQRLATHAASEMQKYDEEVVNSSIALDQDSAVLHKDDMNAVADSISRQIQTIDKFAVRQGKPAEWVTQQKDLLVAKTHSKVIDGFLANDQDLKAKEYFEAIKPTVKDGETLTRLEKTIQEGSSRGESQRLSDQIISAHKDQSAALEAARKITDPKLRDLTVERTLQYFNQKKQAESLHQDDLVKTSEKLILSALQANPTMTEVEARDLIPPSTLNQLPVKTQNALFSIVSDPPQDSKKWLTFLEVQGNLDKMSRTEFVTDYWQHFDKEHRAKAENIWMEAKSGKLGADKISDNISFKERVDNAVRAAGYIKPNEKPSNFSQDQAKLMNDLQDASDKAINEFERNDLGGKRKATGDEKQKIIENLVSKKVFIDQWGFDKSLPARFVKPEDREKAYVPFKDIPTEHKNRLTNLIRSYGKTVSEDKISRAYGALLVGDEARADSILKGY